MGPHWRTGVYSRESIRQDESHNIGTLILLQWNWKKKHFEDEKNLPIMYGLNSKNFYLPFKLTSRIATIFSSYSRYKKTQNELRESVQYIGDKTKSNYKSCPNIYVKDAVEGTGKWNTCRAFLITVAVAERVSVWLPSLPWWRERHSFPYHKKRVCETQLLLPTGMCVHTLGLALLKGHTTFPKLDLYNWTWEAIFVDFLLSHYPIPLIFFSAFWLCWLTFFFSKF